MTPPPADGLPGGHAPTSLSRRLWEAHARSHAWPALHHPFVRGLATGSLPPRTFRFYLLQDATFLTAFAAAYDAAREAACVACDDEAIGVLSSLRAAVTDELRLHAAYAASWGLSEDDLAAPPSLATAAYADFLAGAGGGARGMARVARILAAMAPCSRLYGWLGCTLAAARVVERWDDGGVREGAGPHPFADWIATYSSADYLAAGPAAKEALLDRVAAAGDEGEKKRGMERVVGAAWSCESVACLRKNNTHTKKERRTTLSLTGVWTCCHPVAQPVWTSTSMPVRCCSHRMACPARRPRLASSSAAAAAASIGRRERMPGPPVQAGGAFRYVSSGRNNAHMRAVHDHPRCTHCLAGRGNRARPIMHFHFPFSTPTHTTPTSHARPPVPAGHGPRAPLLHGRPGRR
jgi:thiaminase (transcriptional activator TenA)